MAAGRMHCLARTPPPVGRASASRTCPRTPRCPGPGSESIPSGAEASTSPRTPSPVGRRALPQTPPRPSTRGAKAQLSTPTPCPRGRRVALESEIDAAVRERCLLSLQLALSRGHPCPGAHHISEAVSRGHCGALELLLEAGSEGLDEECRGQRPLQTACDRSACQGDDGYRLAEALLRHGADPACGDVSHTPLHEACRRGNAQMVLLLLQHRADPSAPSPGGHSPLHAACQGAPVLDPALHPKMVDVLLLHGARPLAADDFGLPPRAYAAEGGLYQKLGRAERWWTRRSLRSVCRATADWPGLAPPERGPERLLHGVVTLSGVLGAVLDLVSHEAAPGTRCWQHQRGPFLQWAPFC